MNVEDLQQSLKEFFCVFMHAVLYAAEIYPQATFEARRYYETACWQNAHPGVSEWCEQTTTLIYETLKEHRCRSLSFVVVDRGHPRERFVVDVSHLSSALKAKFHPRNLQQQFRATVMAVHQLNLENPVDHDRTITVAFTADESLVTDEADTPWFVGERKLDVPQTHNVRPIRFIEASSLSMGVYYVARDAII